MSSDAVMNHCFRAMNLALRTGSSDTSNVFTVADVFVSRMSTLPE